jgi:hypothetical protein
VKSQLVCTPNLDSLLMEREHEIDSMKQ